MTLKISKLFYVLLIFYYGWFQVTVFQIPNMLMFLGAGLLGFIILHAVMNKNNILDYISIELFFWILFALTSLIFGLFVAINLNNLLSSITNFFQFLMLIFSITYISKQDNRIHFFTLTFALLSILSAVSAVSIGTEYGSGRISLGDNNNPNALGITMVIGIICVLLHFNFKKTLLSLLSIASTGLLFYVCILTGSRKSFISMVIIFTYWLVFVVPKNISLLNLTNKVKGITLLSLFGIIISFLLIPNLSSTVLFNRLTSLFDEGSDAREGMYEEAIYFFMENPLVGLGFNNYRDNSFYGTYSHSTYAEALACTGIIGGILYFTPYLILLIKYLKLTFSRKTNTVIKSRLILGLFFVLVFLGIGIIHFYSLTSSIAFGIIIAFYSINKKRHEEQKGEINIEDFRSA